MPAEVTISPPRDDRDLESLAAITMHAFQIPPERVHPYYQSLGKENLRLARLGDEVAGGLALIPMAQFWGGGDAAQPVPMTGIAAVAVAPEHRSGGVGLRLMQSVIRECHQSGVALSTLYPATQPVYRKAGYEVAGHSCEIRVVADQINIREPSLSVRPLTPDDQSAVRALYRQWAGANPGSLDRNELMWNRVEDHRGIKRRGYVLTGTNGIEGYFYYGHKSGQYPQVLEVGDYVVTTPAASRRFWQFLADHRSMAEKACWMGPPQDPLLLLLREQFYEISAKTAWMLRIIRPEEALELRSYPAGLSASLQLELTDDLLPQNSGRYHLAVENGRGSVQRAATAGAVNQAVTLTIGALAPLYSAMYSARQLADLGLMAGTHQALATASAIFAGPVPWMRDLF